MAAAAERVWRSPAAPALVLGATAGVVAISNSLPLQASAVAGALLVPCAWMVFSIRRFGLILLLTALLLLPPLPLPYGDTGPHPAVAVALLCVLAGLTRLSEWRVPLNSLTLSFTAFVAAMIASVGFALVHSGATVATGSAVRVGLFAIAPFVFLSSAYGPDRPSPVQAVRVARLLFGVAVVAGAIGILDFVYQLPAPAGFEPQFVWLDSGVFRRAQGLFYESSTLGNFCAFFLVMIGVALTEPKEKRLMPSALLCVGAAILTTALILSYSRASAGTVVLAMLTLMVLRRRRLMLMRVVLVSAVCIVAVVAITTIVFPEFFDSYVARLSYSFENLWTTPDRVLSGRVASWGALAGFIADHPWQTLLGVGYKTLPYTTHLGKPVIADNTYLSTLVETGAAGLVSLIALHVAIFAACWRARPDPKTEFFATWMLCFWVGETVQMLSGDLLTYWRILPIFFWVLAQAVQGAAGNADPGS